MRIPKRDQLHHSGVQLVFVPLGRSAAFKVGHVAALVGHDQRPLELTRVGCIDPKIGRQLHGAADPFGHIHKRPVTEYCRIERSEKVVARRHHGAQVLLYQLRVVADSLRDRTENHAGLGKLFLERGDNRNTIEHRIHGHPGEHLLLVQRNTQLFVGAQQLRVHFVQAFRAVAGGFGR